MVRARTLYALRSSELRRRNVREKCSLYSDCQDLELSFRYAATCVVASGAARSTFFTIRTRKTSPVRAVCTSWGAKSKGSAKTRMARWPSPSWSRRRNLDPQIKMLRPLASTHKSSFGCPLTWNRSVTVPSSCLTSMGGANQVGSANVGSDGRRVSSND